MSKKTTAYRSVRKSHFTQISNEVLNNSSLSLESKGLLSIFLSNSESWNLHMKEIINRSKNGRDAHYKALSKLIKHGYIARLEFKQKSNSRFVSLEYIFSDNKSDVVAGIKEAQIEANNNNQIIILTYKEYENRPIEKLLNNSALESYTDDKNFNENSVNIPFTENPYTDIPNTEKPYTETQYNNNSNNTNINNNKQNNTNDMNDYTEKNNRLSNYHSIHANHLKQQSDLEALKHLELQEMPTKTKRYLHNFDVNEIPLLKSVILKSKKSFNNKHESMYMLENIDDELEIVLKRFKGIIVKKEEAVENMQGYLMRSIITELEELHSTNMRKKNFEKG